MTSVFGGDDLVRAASSRGSWRSGSIREVWQGAPDVFQRNSTRRHDAADDEEELKWAAIERLPTYDRVRKGMLQQVMSNGRVVRNEMDVTNLGAQDKKQLMESILKVVEDDNDKFLRRLRDRTDRVGIEIPKIEVRFQNLSIEGDAYVGTRALPTLLNTTLNTLEGALGLIGVAPSKKRIVKILKDVSGIIRPSRLTLLLGPPGAGKTTLLQALAGKSDEDLRIKGKVTYCGKEFKEFVPQRTSAYISQHDLHYGEMTVRDTLDFSGRCLGVGTRYEMLLELSRREKEAGIKPDPEIDAFMKATAMAGQETSLITDYVLKILGLDICADIMVGDDMRRGISGGQKKRVYYWYVETKLRREMLVGPAKAFFMDEISTGLDSSTTFQIVNLHPETYDLFDDIILLSEGQIVYQGPRENVLEFFEHMGFKCPERKGVADFLQEVTSKMDQEQYWFKKNQPYRYVSVPDFAQAFNSFHIGHHICEELRVPYDKLKVHPAALVTENYGISNWELFRACFAREWLLMKRNSFLYIFKTTQLTIMAVFALTVFFRTEMKYGRVQDSGKFWGALFFSLINVMFNGMAELAMTVFRLPVFYKQRDSLFYPAWAFGLPIWITRIPVSLVESAIWIVLQTTPSFLWVHQMALALFRFLAAAGRTPVVANTMGTFTLLLVFVLGGFIVSKNDIKSWLLWGYYVSPMMYGLNAISINEYLDDRWSAPINGTGQPTVGKTILKERGCFVDPNWYWISIGGATSSTVGTANQARKGMVLPFKPLSLAFNHVNYYVDMPAEMKSQGIEENRLQLLRDVSGAFRPGVLTALVGLFLMKRGGQVIYAGPLGRQSHKLVEYFEAIPGVPKIKEGINPATWMLDVSATAVEAQLDVDFAEIYANSDLYRRNQELIKELSSPAPDARDLYFPTQYNAIRFFMTTIIGILFGVIFWKKGNKINKQQDLLNLLGATYSAVLFLGATNASAVQSVVAVERTVFYRERAAGMYSELPYAFAQVAIETIYVVVQTILYALLLYSMIGYEWTAVKFLYFYYFIFMCFTYFSMYGMMVVALTPGHQIAAVVMSFFLSFWNLFSGFLIPRPLIPIWWRWYYWGSPVAWTIYGIFASQVGDKDVPFHITGVQHDTTVKIFLKESLGFDYDFLIPVVFAHVGWVLLFFFVFAYGIKFLNFQRR
ncbi:pleiotropic drug resistance 6 [Actinidia rufa]|uniref:Pleiotropic drug resistance 6 n=1 Tax=Actinidia rufa TaxID=165716 RepID=A0A7J0HBI4_9ERIC|nr:pleiotropic drug resistance 6 [Actinidia rufa]